MHVVGVQCLKPKRIIQAREPLKIVRIGILDGHALVSPETLKDEVRVRLLVVHAQEMKKRERMCRRPCGLAEGSLKLELLLAVLIDDGNHYWDEWGSL